MATIEEEGQVLALFQMTPPHPLNLIFTNDKRLEECMDLLIRNLLELEIEMNSIISLKPWAYLFSEKWEVKTGMTRKVLMDQGLYRLDTVDETLVPSPGSWRFALQGDCPLIEKWFNLFEEDAGLPLTAKKDVKNELNHLWPTKKYFCGSMIKLSFR